MPTQYTHYANPYGGASGQKRVYDAPEEGEVFTNVRGAGGRYNIYQFKGGKMVELTPSSFKNTYTGKETSTFDTTPPQTVKGAKEGNYIGNYKNTQTLDAWNKAILAELGIDNVSKLPQYNQANMAFWGETHDPNRAKTISTGELGKASDVTAGGWTAPTEPAKAYSTGATATDISDEEAAAQGAARVSDVAPGVAPEGQPAGAHGYAGDTDLTGTSAQVPGGATQPPTTPQWSSDEYVDMLGARTGLSDEQKASIKNLLDSGNPFTEEDAKNFAYATGSDDFAEFVGKTGNEAMNVAEGTTEGLPSAGTTTGATFPENQKLTEGKEDLMGNADWINKLFEAYHGRPANAEEIAYWSNKKVTDLEKTLVQTGIFSGEDADAIRAQMMAEGKTYIRNQAELEALAGTTGIDISSIEPGSMMFQEITLPSGQVISPDDPNYDTYAEQQEETTGVADTELSPEAWELCQSYGFNEEQCKMADLTVTTAGPDADEEAILNAANDLINSELDPELQERLSMFRQELTVGINNLYEDRIRELQTESYNLAENISNTQKNLEASGMTFSGEAIKKLGTLSAFAQGTEEGLTPAQLGQEGAQMAGGQPVRGAMPTMTPEQMGLEGDVNKANRLTAESSRSGFNRNLYDIGYGAEQYLGSESMQGLIPNYTPLGGVQGALPKWYTGAKDYIQSGFAPQQQWDLTTAQEGFY